ncbi:hypothetical protein Syun_029104 [Stephania yunnanensis]|uniref:Polygalacturonase n=1 Tax=Stephania yunnanensis TaxID=152371 RepID=A0AAP0E4S0_9MAGN
MGTTGLVNLLVIILCWSFVAAPTIASNHISIARINVLDYGAIGDGKHDNSQAFLRAWEDFCSVDARLAVFHIPRDRLYLLKPVKFSGPCRARRLDFEIFGDIVAPKLKDWDGLNKGGVWILFDNVDRLIVYGNGQIDGQGDDWWQNFDGKNDQRPKGGSGYARNMTFENIRFEKVKNPIIIDQFYFSNGQNQPRLLAIVSPRSCAATVRAAQSRSHCPRLPAPVAAAGRPPSSASQAAPLLPCAPVVVHLLAVNVSDITYKNITGSSVSNDGISLRCSDAIPCTGIVLDQGIGLVNLLVIFLGCLVAVCLTISDDSIARVNVLDYGAVGDGKHDDSDAFTRAWKDFCMVDAQIAVFHIPRDMLFLLKPVEFSGPCKARKLDFQVFGDLVMPKMEYWDDKEKGGAWIFFAFVQGLVMYGNGHVDGQGSDCVGSLGGHGKYDTVEGVKVTNCKFTGTSNGVRIKTVPGGSGYARNITFENIIFESVENPIIIDQFYSYAGSKNQGTPKNNAVSVSDIIYKNISGSSLSTNGITLHCSDAVPCTGIVMDQVNITLHNTRHRTNKIYSDCSNAQGHSTSTFPPVQCLQE